MKKTIITLFVIMLSLSLVTSCSNNPIGKYTLVSMTVSGKNISADTEMDIEFFDDGTYKWKAKGGFPDSGTYKLDGNSMTLTSKQVGKINGKIDGKKFIMDSFGGSKMVFEKK